MVRLLLLLFPLLLAAESVDVKAEVSPTHVYEHYPIRGTVLVTHPKEQEVESFSYEGKPLEAELERRVQIPPLVLSIYQFEIPAMPAGEQTLGPVGVKVGGKMYESLPVRYRVFRADVPENFEEPMLKLQVKVEASDPLYPGQRVKFIYRYVYRGNITMTHEELPLLQPQGFKVIGEVVARHFEEGDKSIREITLEAEAENPGVYTFSKSVIEGEAMIPGRPPLELQSEAPAVTLTVAPFPQGNQPKVFQGAYGHFEIESALLSSPQVKVGDRLTLAIDIEGDPKQLQDLHLPSLFCQPGFPGMFVQDDRLSAGKIEGGKKRFILYLRPVHDQVRQIPPISLTFYDPETRRYAKKSTEPIPIQVEPVESVERLDRFVASQKGGDEEEWRNGFLRVRPVQVDVVRQISESDLSPPPFGSWYALLVIPFGAAAVGGQIYLKGRLNARKRRSEPLTPRELFEMAKQAKGDKTRFYQLIDQILRMAGEEEMRAEIERSRFGREIPMDQDKILYKVERLIE